MNRYEFLTQLEEQLRGFVSSQEVRDSVQYYQSYIEEEIRAGRLEEEILEDLGSANSIAKAIIEARGHESDTDTIYEDSEENQQEDRAGSTVRVFQTGGWKGAAILIGILAVLVLLLIFAFRIFVALLPFMIPFALILFLIKLVTGKR